MLDTSERVPHYSYVLMKGLSRILSPGLAAASTPEVAQRWDSRRRSNLIGSRICCAGPVLDYHAGPSFHLRKLSAALGNTKGVDQ